MKARYSLSNILLFTAILALVFAYCSCLRIRDGSYVVVNGVQYYHPPSNATPERHLTLSELAIRATFFSALGFWICRKIAKQFAANDSATTE